MSFRKYALITGSNSGLGFGIATRLLQFYQPRLQDEPEVFTVILTCRSREKAEDACRRLKEFFPDRKIRLEYVLLDLSNMASVEAAVQDIATRFPKLDFVYLNAGAWDLEGIQWLKAIFSTLINPIQALTHPTFYKETAGRVSNDSLGYIFESNVFGHFYLKNRLAELKVLRSSTKVVLTSSLVAEKKSLDFEDLQCFHGEQPYQSSKRLLDVLHYAELEKGLPFEQYLVHPGLCTTNMYETFLGPILVMCAKLGFYICRLLGSPWHTISPYVAAFAFLWTALHATKEDQSIKWGAAVTRFGHERVLSTPVELILPSEQEKALEYMTKLYQEWKKKLVS
ncbi:3-keto sterol reductase Erg27 [Schizosaccharomyces pombe]|uniref:3-keto-steroid reductase erg27 n=1 Tax=Schizosaccharomyces pombe (strain 972 / ATCC 24843) TaxID=284812 RepID=ERG27_SCHPO|nr:putative 3-keto sterol reductase [Schizosaccharomyces pombe]O74732.1 RecName: Full=3-keto-steroid reductase erg27; AltName: Full=Ergosterol biosynthetic protein 27 [Schizosaccharomyces pombe 972h-]CAA21246.1 3-keto sterol reductase (predicted) [Schizosaccharomyces pombe]|eukprot:NP_595440.1 putative 3-keto sterol reductase [Schizosaccharomyces pombe]